MKRSYWRVGVLFFFVQYLGVYSILEFQFGRFFLYGFCGCVYVEVVGRLDLVVDVRGVVVVFREEYFGVVEVFQDVYDIAAVLVVGDTVFVVDFFCCVFEDLRGGCVRVFISIQFFIFSLFLVYFVGDVIIFIQEYFELVDVDAQVFVCEFVGDVEVQGFKFTAFQSIFMKQVQRQQQGFEFYYLWEVEGRVMRGRGGGGVGRVGYQLSMFYFVIGVEEVVIEVVIGFEQVGFDVSWWFNGYFGVILQDGYWEFVVGQVSELQAEVSVYLVVVFYVSIQIYVWQLF